VHRVLALDYAWLMSGKLTYLTVEVVCTVWPGATVANDAGELAVTVHPAGPVDLASRGPSTRRGRARTRCRRLLADHVLAGFSAAARGGAIHVADQIISDPAMLDSRGSLPAIRPSAPAAG